MKMNVISNRKVRWTGLLVCLALLTGLTMVRTTRAEPFFSSSRYAYFAGDVDSWDRDPSVDEGFVCVAPINSVLGNEPEAWLLFDKTINVIVIPPNSTQCYLTSTEIDCYIGNFSTVQLGYDEKDFYGSGVWRITEKLWISNANITNIQHYVNGFQMTTMVICVTSNTASEAFIKEITAFAAEANISNITAYVSGQDLVDPSEVAREISAYAAEANIADVRLYVQGINLTDTFTVPYFDIMVEYDGVTDGTGEPRTGLVQITHQENDSPGELYAVGNWTDFTANIKGLGVVSGKVTDHVVKNEDQGSAGNTINVKMDVNFDRRVDILDVSAVARAFGCTKDSPRYNPLFDINSDFVINIVDIAMVAKGFGMLV
jgi:hypothetical protein